MPADLITFHFDLNSRERGPATRLPSGFYRLEWTPLTSLFAERTLFKGDIIEVQGFATHMQLVRIVERAPFVHAGVLLPPAFAATDYSAALAKSLLSADATCEIYEKWGLLLHVPVAGPFDACGAMQQAERLVSELRGSDAAPLEGTDQETETAPSADTAPERDDGFPVSTEEALFRLRIVYLILAILWMVCSSPLVPAITPPSVAHWDLIAFALGFALLVWTALPVLRPDLRLLRAAGLWCLLAAAKMVATVLSSPWGLDLAALVPLHLVAAQGAFELHQRFVIDDAMSRLPSGPTWEVRGFQRWSLLFSGKAITADDPRLNHPAELDEGAS